MVFFFSGNSFSGRKLCSKVSSSNFKDEKSDLGVISIILYSFFSMVLSGVKKTAVNSNKNGKMSCKWSV